jgi:hypothetical protein
MKKILLVLLLTLPLFAQNTDKNDTFLGADETLWKVFQKTAEVLRVANVGGAILDSTDFTSGTSNKAVKGDTLVGSDTLEFDFGSQFKHGYIVLEDTAASVDTVTVEWYDPIQADWTARAIGLQDVATNSVQNGVAVLLNASGFKKFLINEFYPSKIRIRFYYGANKGTKYVPLTFIGVN